MTDLAHLVQELRQTLGKLELALGAISDAIVWTDRDGVIQWCNGSFDRLVERPHIEVLGARLSDLLPLQQAGHSVSEEGHPVRRALTAQAVDMGCYEFKREGRTISLEISGAQIRFDQTNQDSVFVLLDITERKQAEESLRATQRALERKVKELELLNQVMMGREERILELKEEVKKLRTASRGIVA